MYALFGRYVCCRVGILRNVVVELSREHTSFHGRFTFTYITIKLRVWIFRISNKLRRRRRRKEPATRTPIGILNYFEWCLHPDLHNLFEEIA